MCYIAYRHVTFDVRALTTLRLTIMSIVLCSAFPRFLRSIERQGAAFEVVERLHFFKEMHHFRTVFRGVFSICYVSELDNPFTFKIDICGAVHSQLGSHDTQPESQLVDVLERYPKSGRADGYFRIDLPLCDSRSSPLPHVRSLSTLL